MADHPSGPQGTRKRSGDVMNRLEAAYRAEVGAFRQARAGKDIASAWRFLERAHILSQSVLRLHLHAHVMMLAFAISRWEWREALGQVFRLLLAPLGALLGRIPIGNIGRTSVSAFMPMPIPEDLQRVLYPSREDSPNRACMKNGRSTEK